MAPSVYGVLIALGFLAAYGATLFLARRTTLIAEAHIDRALLWAVIPAVAGARALFVLYHLDYFFIHPEEIVAVWRGGWVFHGALGGGIIGLWFYCKRSGISFLAFLDILVPGVALGQAIGRWGNFFNQEAYGLPTSLPWAITIDPERRLAGYESFVSFHPTFLYESMFDLLLFLFLAAFLLKYRDPSRNGRNGGRNGRRNGVRYHFGSKNVPDTISPPISAGTVFFLYLFLYSLGRFFIEFLRVDTVPVVVGFRAPQWISVGLIIIGAWGLYWVLRKQKKIVY